MTTKLPLKTSLKKGCMNNQIAIYIHWPFCLSLCPYCDFNSHVATEINHATWANSYLKELEYFLPQIKGKKITSVFFGGGTPSLMNASTISTILNFLTKNCLLEATTEITLEANPTSVESKKFEDFKSAGINRLSIGVQSFIEEDLKTLGRKHSAGDAIKAIELASEKFTNFSFDVIYARPNQTLKSWHQELELALSFNPKHISLYQLTIEKGTPFFKLFRDGKLQLPDNELAADMFELTNEITKYHNFERYEISNYANLGFECKHNLNYWDYGNYLGIGPGSHSRINGKAIMMLHNPKNWLSQIEKLSHGIQKETMLAENELINEIIMMGLRLSKGISLDNFKSKTDKNFIELINQDYLNILLQNNLAEIKDNFFRLLPSGLNLHSYILSRLLA